MNERFLYDLWCQKAREDTDIINELKDIKDNESEIYDRFYKDIEFGTGGLRGVIGAGTNRINIYTVRKVSQGLSNYICQQYDKPSVAIAYDSRLKSNVFAENAAGVFASNGVKVYIFKMLMPTPALSFAVRHLRCSAGVVITASHNPSKYNGYKVYGDDGCQITLNMAESIFEKIKNVDMFDDIKYREFDECVDKGIIEYISDETVDKYIDAVSSQALNSNMDGKNNLKIVYTPLNGAGCFCVSKVLSNNGFNNVTVVPEQKDPDGNFPTCPYPNPEIKDALNKGLELSKKINADLLLATDPDCDRVGVAVKHEGNYCLISGNQVGVLLFDYICRSRIKNLSMPRDPVVIKTIVTTEMLKPMADKYGVEVIDVLTGFKFIGEQIGYLEDKSQVDRYIFGFEESCGYLSGSYVRDKDGVNASLLICEMVCYYKNIQKTLIDILDELYKEYGYYETLLDSFEFTGSLGSDKMKSIMKEFRSDNIKEIAGKQIESVYDYLSSVQTDKNGETKAITLPKSNVIKFELEGRNNIIVRPSGTEPKLKVYYLVKGETLDEARSVLKDLHNYFNGFICS